jgi:uncharacterized protein YjaZ
MGYGVEVWRERVRRVRPQDYGFLREVVADSDLSGVARDAMARCQKILPLPQEPEIYFLVGFFSPDGFAFQVEERWAIGIGMERIAKVDTIKLLLAHEYMHCYRNKLGRPTTLGERMVEEGFAVEMAARAFPDVPHEQHMMVRGGQLHAFREYENRLWEAVGELLDSRDQALAARVLYGRAEGREWPSRAGMYLGWRLVQHFLDSGRGGFDAAAAHVLGACDRVSARRCR